MAMGLSRRGLLGGITAGLAGGGLAAGGYAVGHESPAGSVGSAGQVAASYPFRGVHQAGITTPAQDRLHFAAFDVITEDRAALVDLRPVSFKWPVDGRQRTTPSSCAPGD